MHNKRIAIKNKILKHTIGGSVLFLFFFLTSCNEILKTTSNNFSTNKNILLIGVAHFNDLDHFGFKASNVLNEENQKALYQIASSINDFNPTKIYIEWPKKEQQKLDSLYQIYLSSIQSSEKPQPTNEIYQLVFRIGKLANIKNITAVDVGNSMFPTEAILANLDSLGRIEYMNGLNTYQKEIEKELRQKINNNASLKEIISYSNTNKFKERDLQETHKLLEFGKIDNSTNVKIFTKWYAKHLGIWSFIQKDTKKNKDHNVLVIYGASHIAILEKMIEINKEWNIIPVQSVL